MKHFLLLLLFAIQNFSSTAQTAKYSQPYTGYNLRYLGNSDDIRYYTYYTGAGGDFSPQVIGLDETGKEVKKLTIPNAKNAYNDLLFVNEGKIICMATAYKKVKADALYTIVKIQELSLSTGKPINAGADLLAKMGAAPEEFVMDFYGKSYSENKEWFMVSFKLANKEMKMPIVVIGKNGEVKYSAKIEFPYTEKESALLVKPQVNNSGEVYYACRSFKKEGFVYHLGYVNTQGSHKVKTIDLPNEPVDLALDFDKGANAVITYTYAIGKEDIFVGAYGFYKFEKGVELAKKNILISESAGNAMGKDNYAKKKAVPYLTPVGTYFRTDGSAVVVTQQRGVHSNEGPGTAAGTTYSQSQSGGTFTGYGYSTRPTAGDILLFALSSSHEEKSVKAINVTQEGTAAGLGCSVIQQSDDLLIFNNTDFKPGADLKADLVMRKLEGNNLSEPKVVAKDSPNDVDVTFHTVAGKEVYFYTNTDYTQKMGVMFLKLQ